MPSETPSGNTHYDPHDLPQNLRRYRRRRRTRRHGSRTRRRPYGRADAFALTQYRNARTNVVQPLYRRHRQRAFGARTRRARRRDGVGNRQIRYPVPPPERQQRRGSACHARAGGPHPVQSRHPRNVGKPRKPRPFPTSRRRRNARRRTHQRRNYRDGRGV